MLISYTIHTISLSYFPIQKHKIPDAPNISPSLAYPSCSLLSARIWRAPFHHSRCCNTFRYQATQDIQFHTENGSTVIRQAKPIFLTMLTSESAVPLLTADCANLMNFFMGVYTFFPKCVKIVLLFMI